MDPESWTTGDGLQVGLDALKNIEPVHAIAAKHQAHPTQVNIWKKEVGLESLAPKPGLSAADQAHPVYLYQLRELAVTGPNQVWATDITGLSLPGGHVCLCAVLDWHSRYVLSWELSNTSCPTNGVHLRCPWP